MLKDEQGLDKRLAVKRMPWHRIKRLRGEVQEASVCADTERSALWRMRCCRSRFCRSSKGREWDQRATDAGSWFCMFVFVVEQCRYCDITLLDTSMSSPSPASTHALDCLFRRKG